MKLTAYDRATTSRDYREATHEPTHRQPAARPKAKCGPARVRISQAHVRMFLDLREQGYSWRQIGAICGISWSTVKGAVRAAHEGRVFPEVTTTVLQYRLGAVGEPTGKRGAA